VLTMDAVPLTEREIRLLDYHAIREKLAQKTVTAYGEERALGLLPSAEYREVKDSLNRTSQACLILENNYFQLKNVPEIRNSLAKLSKEGVLGAEELSSFILFLQGCGQVEKASKKEEVREHAPAITYLMEQVQECRPLLEELDSCLSNDGELLDSASPLLRDLRRQARSLKESIRENLDNYIKSSSYQKYLQEPIVTVRNGRYVIPVKQEHRNSIKGMVHDQSSRGVTLFIEPYPVVELQNKLQRIGRQEQEEIERILKELSYAAAEYYHELSGNVEVYGFLDLLMAKAQVSLDTGSVEPGVTREKIIELREARHPLLERAVPVEVKIGEDYRVMVITGPNTGGKTVTLKTTGLMAVMAQSGLHLPVLHGSRVGVFKGIYADIGDEQSIEQSLSTFSGHLKNIVEIIDKADNNSLVLLDELGAGTDPSEGAALARAILMELYHRGSLVAATTHINELKLFAQLEEGLQNASMEFDEETFSPTFRLLPGVPGKSNALVIAERLGLPSHVLQQAREYMQEGHGEVEDMIGSLTREQKKLHRESQAADREREKVEQLRRELEKEREEIKQKKEEILREAKREARELVKKAKKNADASLQELQQLYESMKKEAEADAQLMGRAEDIRHSLKKDLAETTSSLVEQDQELEEKVLDKESVEEGKEVWVKSLKQKGTIIKYSSSEEMLLVQVGMIKVNTSLEDIAPTGDTTGAGEGEKVPLKGYTFLNSSSSQVSPEIYVRGLTLEEAIEEVDKYIDNAVMAGLNQVYLVHGKGTGTLRRGLHQFLKNKNWVRDWRLGDHYEGGSGVTVINLGKKD